MCVGEVGDLDGADTDKAVAMAADWTTLEDTDFCTLGEALTARNSFRVGGVTDSADLCLGMVDFSFVTDTRGFAVGSAPLLEAPPIDCFTASCRLGTMYMAVVFD